MFPEEDLPSRAVTDAVQKLSRVDLALTSAWLRVVVDAFSDVWFRIQGVGCRGSDFGFRV